MYIWGIGSANRLIASFSDQMDQIVTGVCFTHTQLAHVVVKVAMCTTIKLKNYVTLYNRVKPTDTSAQFNISNKSTRDRLLVIEDPLVLCRMTDWVSTTKTLVKFLLYHEKIEIIIALKKKKKDIIL